LHHPYQFFCSCPHLDFLPFYIEMPQWLVCFVLSSYTHTIFWQLWWNNNALFSFSFFPFGFSLDGLQQECWICSTCPGEIHPESFWLRCTWIISPFLLSNNQYWFQDIQVFFFLLLWTGFPVRISDFVYLSRPLKLPCSHGILLIVHIPLIVRWLPSILCFRPICHIYSPRSPTPAVCATMNSRIIMPLVMFHTVPFLFVCNTWAFHFWYAIHIFCTDCDQIIWLVWIVLQIELACWWLCLQLGIVCLIV